MDDAMLQAIEDEEIATGGAGYPSCDDEYEDYIC